MTRFAVAGPSGVVTDAARGILELGGSVVDAAIVASLTAMCTEPGVCAPLGGGFMTIDVVGAPPVVVDGYMSYPGIGFGGTRHVEEVSMEYGGGVTTQVGPASIGVPGSFAALARASDMFGRASWQDLMETVASAVAGGFPLSQACYNYLIHSGAPIFAADPVSRAALFDGDELKSVGDMVYFEGLAETLHLIGREGASILYQGELGSAIVEDLQSRGGDLTRRDLVEYTPIVREPLRIDLAGWEFEANPAPAVGGTTVALALAGVGEAGSSDLNGVATALIDSFETRARELEPGPGFESATRRALARAGILSPSTIAVSAVDSDGNAVAASFSGGYGSGVIPQGTGMLTNNGVGEIELAGTSTPVPGTRLMSNMAPMVGRRGSDVVALSSPGASRITSALTCTALGLARGLPLAEAIELPRVHPEFGDWGVRIAVEPGAGVTRHAVREFDELHMFFGGVTGAALEDGEVHGHADSRRTGSAIVVG